MLARFYTKSVTMLGIGLRRSRLLSLGIVTGMLAPLAGMAPAHAIPGLSDLEVTMTQSVDRVNVAVQGATVTYTMTVRNNGPADAAGVTLTDVIGDKSGGALLPSPLNYTITQGAAVADGTTASCVEDNGVRGYPHTVTCPIGWLPVMATATVTLVLRPNLNNFFVQQTDGAIVNAATVTSDPSVSVDPTSNNNSDSKTTTVVKYAIGMGDAEVVEGNAGSTEIVFNVYIDGATTSTITVDYTTSDGTAVAGSDYTATSGTLTFPIQGQALAPLATPGYQEVRVPVSGDTTVEADETFTLTLANQSPADTPYAYGTQTATGTIRNDD